MRWLIVLACLTGTARADWSVDMGLDVGGVIGHGPLSDRLDAVSTAGVRLAVMTDAWLVDGGFVVLASMPGRPDALDAIGWSARVRRTIDTSEVGATFVGVGVSELALERTVDHMPVRAGRAVGPKLTAGVDFSIFAGDRRHIAIEVAATYQWLFATLSDGTALGGGYAGLELGFVNGVGRTSRR